MSFNKAISIKSGLLKIASAVAISVFAIGMTTITSQAASSGKVTAAGVNVRKEASSNSDQVGKKDKGDAITINGQVTGADGYVWYQIDMGGSVGYVRSDLATVTDGSIPDTIGADGTVTSGDATINKVNPVAGAVTGGQAVRVRQDASTSSTIVTSADSGTALTVNGTKEGTDSRTWYYVSFEQEGNTVSGFIRSDFIELSGELTALGSETNTATEETPVEAEPVEEEKKAYDTALEGEEWYLFDYEGGQKYSIKSIFENLDGYKATVAKQKKTITGLRVAMIIFIILTVAAAGFAAFLFLRLRESGDQQIFAAVDKERKAKLAEKQAGQRPASAGQRPAGAGQRPAGAQGQRPAGAGQRPAGPQGQRPAGPQGQRPAGPQGQRPAGPQGQRPAGPQGQRPAGPQGQRPAGAPGQRTVSVNGQRQVIQEGQRISQAPERTAARPVQTQEGAERPQGQRPVQSAQPQAPAQKPNTAPARQSVDDDDFEFGFLNWDGDKN